MTQTLTIRRPDDWHVHVRQDEMMSKVLRYTAAVMGRALLMPNTVPPILTGEDALRYRKEVKQVTGGLWPHFSPIMTIKLLDATAPGIILEAHHAGVTAAKLYPAGVTTHSQDGVTDVDSLWPAFAMMEKLGMVLCVHGEMPGVSVLEAEGAYLDTIERICASFPRLKVVMEHVSTAAAVDFVKYSPHAKLAASVTLHHLLLTIDEVVGHPHHYCKPVAKLRSDMMALRDAACSADPRFFLGSDSAPHPAGNKEAASCSAGVYSAPVLLPLLAEVFEQEGALARLEQFASVNGANFYGFPKYTVSVTLVKQPWVVPDQYDGIVPFWAGREISWQLALH